MILTLECQLNAFTYIQRELTLLGCFVCTFMIVVCLNNKSLKPKAVSEQTQNVFLKPDSYLKSAYSHTAFDLLSALLL